MIIILKHNASFNEIDELVNLLNQTGNQAYFIKAHNLIVLSKFNNDINSLVKNSLVVDEVKNIESPYKLSSFQYKSETEFVVKNNKIGSKHYNIIAGPCSVESEEQIFATAEFLNKQNIAFIRGGAYKPRTSPYSFKGLGLQGLKLIREAADTYNLTVVTELLDLSLLDEVSEYADIIQIGSRNMSNFYMLTELGKINKPILLKRGMSAKISEWLLAADYILSGGNENVILCERGIRSFDPEQRNVMDIGAISLIKQLSHLPVWADPSHGTGNAKIVKPLSLASYIAGANGLMVEIHPYPQKALSDSKQALSFNEFEDLLSDLNQLKDLSQKAKNTAHKSITFV
ncbi:MAG: 3-deoxy-7-phosphoheptulonate synthase [Bacteroidia bacterium]